MVVLSGLALFSWFGRDTSGPLGEDYDDARSFPTACGAEPPPPAAPMQFSQPADQALTGSARAVIETSCGSVTIELDPASAPAAVNSFAFLADQGFYDGTVFHRLLEGRELRGGDPRGNGEGGPGYTTPDEPPAEGFRYEYGVVAMVRGDRPDTTGSQFFIVLADDARLPSRFGVIGRVVDGFDTLDRIEGIEVGPGLSAEASRPRQTIYIETIRIEPGP